MPAGFTETANVPAVAPLVWPDAGFTASHFPPSAVEAAAWKVTGCALLVFTATFCGADAAPPAATTKNNPAGLRSGTGGELAAPRSRTTTTYTGELCAFGSLMLISA